MSTGTRHTVTAFDDDMDEIRGLIAEMGARAESAVMAAMKALGEHDTELAAATRIWRRMFPSEEYLAKNGLKFMKSRWEAKS